MLWFRLDSRFREAYSSGVVRSPTEPSRNGRFDRQLRDQAGPPGTSPNDTSTEARSQLHRPTHLDRPGIPSWVPPRGPVSGPEQPARTPIAGPPPPPPSNPPPRTASESRAPPDDPEERGTMARAAVQRDHGTQHTEGTEEVQVMAQPARKTARDKDHARHFGPYGVSFNGQNPDGSKAKGLTFERRWTRPGVHPYDEIRWETRTASIGNESGKLVFEQKDVEVPEFWSQLATNVVVSKYFRGHLGTPGARDERPPADRPGRQHDRRLGRDPALLRDGRGPARLPGRADPPARPPEDELQLAGLVQRRDRGAGRSARPASSTRSRTR